MKNFRVFAAFFGLLLSYTSSFSQTGFRKEKVGHVFNISLPEYMNKTLGLNDAAAIQFVNNQIDIAGIVVLDTKSELALAELNFASAEAFYKDFMTDFLTDEASKKIGEPVSKVMGKNNYVECQASYFDSEVNMELHYFIGIVETPNAYYKVLCWGSKDNLEKYLGDFQKILYSIQD